MANSNPTPYVRNKVSCLLCQKVVTHNQMGQHYDSNLCKVERGDRHPRKAHYCYEHKMSMKDLDTLLEEAGIEYEQIGQRKGQYHLARYGDTGPYEIGNCRFILGADNIRESKRPGGQWGKYERTEAHRKAVGDRFRK